jgi:hypothetical protein
MVAFLSPPNAEGRFDQANRAACAVRSADLHRGVARALYDCHDQTRTSILQRHSTRTRFELEKAGQIRPRHRIYQAHCSPLEQ